MSRKPRKFSAPDAPTPAQALAFVHQVKVDGWLDLGNEWQGWKLRGPYLVSPAGDRILPQRLLGICMTEAMRTRARVKRAHAPQGPRQPDPLPIVVQLPRRRVA